MNLTKLFETQEKLDSRIVEKKRLKGRDLLPEKILALLTELGELSNEWRGFKFWSEDREPRMELIHKDPHGQCASVITNPLLEEYIDDLHFILSLGLEIHPSIAHMGWVASLKENVATLGEPNDPKITELFILIFKDTVKLSETMQLTDYGELFFTFITLGRALGFSWDQIETAYYEKNEINHSRQNNGY